MKTTKQKNALLKLAIILMAVGVLLGMLSANCVDAESVQTIKTFVNNSVDNTDVNFTKIFISGVKQNLAFVICALAGAINMYLFSLFMLAYIMKGFSLGFTLFFIAKHFSLGVSVAVITSAVIYCTVLFPIYVAMFCLSYKYATRAKSLKKGDVLNTRVKMPKLCLVYSIIYIVTCVSSALNAVLNPLLIKLIS